MEGRFLQLKRLIERHDLFVVDGAIESSVKSAAFR